MSNIEIVPAKAEHIPQIARITLESWRVAYKGIVADEYLASLRVSRWIDPLNRDLKAKTMSVMMAVLNGEVIGISGYGRSRHDSFPNDGEIVSMYFLPAYIGKGYGHILMQRVLFELSNLGYNSAVLTTLAANKRARSFYSSWGFEEAEAGLIHLDLDGIDYECLLMRKANLINAEQGEQIHWF